MFKFWYYLISHLLYVSEFFYSSFIFGSLGYCNFLVLYIKLKCTSLCTCLLSICFLYRWDAYGKWNQVIKIHQHSKWLYMTQMQSQILILIYTCSSKIQEFLFNIMESTNILTGCNTISVSNPWKHGAPNLHHYFSSIIE